MPTKPVSCMQITLNWHRENLQSDRVNTWNLKMQFEWRPCVDAISRNKGRDTQHLHLAGTMPALFPPLFFTPLLFYF